MKIKDGKFLITGGASLIGSHISDHLLAAGAREIILFDNYSLGSIDNVKHLLDDKRIKLVKGDITRINELYDSLEGVDGVYAAAAFLSLPLNQNPFMGIGVNIQGHLNVLEACRYRGVKKVIFSSSVATYGNPGPELLEETGAFNWNGMSSGAALYGASKIMGENMGKLYSDRFGVDFIALRYGTVYGERQHYRGVNALYIVETYDRLMAGQRPIIPDDGSEVHDYIHVADIARASLMAMESDVTGETFNILSGEATNLNRLVEIVTEIVGSDLKPEYKNEAGKMRLTTTDKLNFSTKKAKDMLGFEVSIPIEEGIRRVIEWRRSLEK